MFKKLLLAAIILMVSALPAWARIQLEDWLDNNSPFGLEDVLIIGGIALVALVLYRKR